MSKLETEKVSENYQQRPGVMASRKFWIAYAPHVAAYGHMSDRISRASGRGKTAAEALEAAHRFQAGEK